MRRFLRRVQKCITVVLFGLLGKTPSLGTVSQLRKAYASFFGTGNRLTRMALCQWANSGRRRFCSRMRTRLSPKHFVAGLRAPVKMFGITGVIFWPKRLCRKRPKLNNRHAAENEYLNFGWLTLLKPAAVKARDFRPWAQPIRPHLQKSAALRGDNSRCTFRGPA